MDPGRPQRSHVLVSNRCHGPINRVSTERRVPRMDQEFWWFHSTTQWWLLPATLDHFGKGWNPHQNAELGMIYYWVYISNIFASQLDVYLHKPLFLSKLMVDLARPMLETISISRLKTRIVHTWCWISVLKSCWISFAHTHHLSALDVLAWVSRPEKNNENYILDVDASAWPGKARVAWRCVFQHAGRPWAY